MKNFRQLFGLLVLFATLTIVSACKKNGSMSVSLGEDRAITSVPGDASMVMSLNMKSLMDKADFEEIRKMGFYQEMLNDVRGDQPQLAYIFEDPIESGVDLNGKAYFFMEANPEDVEQSFGGVVMALADRAKFEAMLKKAEADVVKKKSYSIVDEDNNGFLAWNDEIMFAGTSTGEDIDNQVKRVLSLKAENSIAKNDKFLNAVKGEHDFSTYMNTAALGEAIFNEQEMMLAAAEIDKSVLTDNVFYSYMDFKDGEIVGASDYQLSSELLKDLKIVLKSSVKTDFAKHIPSEGLTGVMVAGIDFKGLNQMLQEKSGASVGVYKGLDALGLEKSDVIEALNGDMVFAGYMNKDMPNGVVGLKIGDRAKFDKLMDVVIAQSEGMIQKESADAFNVSAGMMPVKVIIKDDIAFISNNQETLAMIQNGLSSDQQVAKSKINSINGGFMGMFVDFSSLADLDEDMADLVNTLVDMQATMNLKKSESVIRLKDKNTNSLKQIFEGINDAYNKENQINM